MKWFRSYSKEMHSKEEDELLNKFGTTGYFIRDRLFKLLSLHLNPEKEFWMNFEFDLDYFKRQFVSYGQRGKLFKVLDHLRDQGELTYRIKNKRIEVYNRTFEKRAEFYVNRFRALAEKKASDTVSQRLVNS